MYYVPTKYTSINNLDKKNPAKFLKKDFLNLDVNETDYRFGKGLKNSVSLLYNKKYVKHIKLPKSQLSIENLNIAGKALAKELINDIHKIHQNL